MLHYEIQGDSLIIYIKDELDHHAVTYLRETSDRLIEAGNVKNIVFDFKDVSFMDSSGIGVIMGRYRHIFLLGGEVWAIHTSERMRQILNMSGVTKIIQIYEEGMM